MCALVALPDNQHALSGSSSDVKLFTSTTAPPAHLRTTTGCGASDASASCARRPPAACSETPHRLLRARARSEPLGFSCKHPRYTRDSTRHHPTPHLRRERPAARREQAPSRYRSSSPSARLRRRRPAVEGRASTARRASACDRSCASTRARSVVSSSNSLRSAAPAPSALFSAPQLALERRDPRGGGRRGGARRTAARAARPRHTRLQPRRAAAAAGSRRRAPARARRAPSPARAPPPAWARRRRRSAAPPPARSSAARTRGICARARAPARASRARARGARAGICACRARCCRVWRAGSRRAPHLDGHGRPHRARRRAFPALALLPRPSRALSPARAARW